MNLAEYRNTLFDPGVITSPSSSPLPVMKQLIIIILSSLHKTAFIY